MNWTLFDLGQPKGPAPFERETLKAQLAELAQEGIFLGTSSWKYPGWCGSLYERSRYEWRGKFTESRFNRECLAEYSEVFKTVCVDAAYYTFPTPKYLEGLAEQVSRDFRFGLKVTDSITLKRFPNLERFGEKAGKLNPDFLNAELFERDFLRPCEAIRSKVGLLMFEFSHFWPADYEHGRDFATELGAFLQKLPGDWPYGVELRNRAWLKPKYFECLARHNVTHVFNSWEAMPPVSEQIALPGSRTRPDLVAARFLLKPGRKYEEAVEAFKPYGEVKEPNAEARQAARTLIAQAKSATPKGRTFIFVNNRLEGNALGTIAAILERGAQATGE